MNEVLRFGVFVLGVLVLGVLVLGCGADADSGSRRGGSDDGSAGVSGAVSAPDLTGDCTTPNLTQACSSCGAGRQVCTSARTWSACQCAERGASPSLADMPGASPAELLVGGVPQGNLDVSVTFDWPESYGVGSGACEAGRYEGTFAGTYTGAYFGPPAGIVGGTSWVPAVTVPIVGLNPFGGPGLVFDLMEEGNGEIFRITGGTFEGTSNGFVPFHARLEGSLDCSTGKFMGDILDGEYDYAAQIYRYEGWLTADYNAQTKSLINGLWEVWEPDTIPNGIGPMMSENFGSGTWQAQWVP